MIGIPPPTGLYEPTYFALLDDGSGNIKRVTLWPRRRVMSLSMGAAMNLRLMLACLGEFGSEDEEPE